MPAWYDILGLNESAQQDSAGIFSSAQAVLKIVEAEERRGVSRDRIVLGGFSQGGAVALVTGLLASNNTKEPFAGILSLSAYVPIHGQFEAAKAGPEGLPLVSKTPIFMGHGTSDMVVSYRWAQQSADFLKKLGCGSLLFKTYKHMEHSVCDEELEDAAKFLRQTLKYEESASRSAEL
jgi:predicted esterase